MSQFMPEQQPTPGTPAVIKPSAETSQEDIALMQRVLGAAAANPTQIPEPLLAYILDWLQVSNLQIPIGQVFGFSQFTIQTKAGSFSPASITATTPSDPPEGAFTLDGLSKGRYFFLYGGRFGIPAGGHGDTIQLELRGSGANVATFDSHAILQNTWNGTTVLQSDIAVSTQGIALFDLADDSNSVSLKAWLANGVGGTLGDRFIASLRFANL